MSTFKDLKDLEVLKKALELEKEVDTFLTERYEKVKDLELILEGYVEEEGIQEYEEVDPRKIAFAMEDAGNEEFENLEKMFREAPLFQAKHQLVAYLRNPKKRVFERKISKEEGLGLFLVASRFYDIFRARREEIKEGLKPDIKSTRVRMKLLQENIEKRRKGVKVKIYDQLEKWKGNKLVNRIKFYIEGWGDVEHYLFLRRSKKRLKKIIDNKRNELRDVQEHDFEPIQLNLGNFMGDLMQKLANTFEGPFDSIDLTQHLRKKVVYVAEDVARNSGGNNINRKMLLQSLYKYSHLIPYGNPEKTYVLTKGLKHVRALMEKNDNLDFRLLGYLSELFIAKGTQGEGIELPLLMESCTCFKKIMKGFEERKYRGDVQLLMHMTNTIFDNFDNFISDLKKNKNEEYGKIRDSCKGENISLRNLYGTFVNMALNSGNVPEKFEGQYRQTNKFGNI
ncbi:MAG: hypothetical protein CMH63_03630 [Nanoarchaeota archaeon]|nr:hypothetical protein [Nanoarchaeota archaeon]|tara:strand:+ start:1252 stop:2607 length:1356 start_codon:yes stop_codon:yes gene_type:complete